MKTEDELAAAARRVQLWREGDRGILRFVDENFHVDLDAWQEEGLLKFASPLPEHRRIAFQACVGPGKSAVLSWCGWWFLAVQGDTGEHPSGLVTAVTGENLRGNLWKEYSKWQQRSPYLTQEFTWTTKAIFSNSYPGTWRIEARSWPKKADTEQQGQTFSGLHAKYVLVQVDEAGNIPTPVLRAGEQALSRCVFGKLEIAGNPTSLEGMLYAAATQLRHLWVIIRVTGDPNDPNAWVNSPRVGDQPRQWAQEQIDTYGRDNPWIKTQVLGLFPPASINALFEIEELEAAIQRKYRPEEYEWHQKRLGVDVARFGDDRTVLFPRQGLVAFKPKVMRNARTTDIAARVARMFYGWGLGDALVFVDDTGHWGHGVIDQLDVAGIPYLPLVYHAKANHPRYKNRRAEMYIEGSKWLKRGGKLPDDRELIGEMTAITYTFDQGAFVIEPKDQIKARLGRSPDKADALMQTFAIPDMPASASMSSVRGGPRARTMDDPDARQSSRERAGIGRATTLDDVEG